ncbi:MAG: NAD-dependent epimerase/dehydratase family protein [Lachnospiraceae bacterium]|nr:NAD-dependent epimerase/dehydratase family protein [Lachnospiraceae bacterium]
MNRILKEDAKVIAQTLVNWEKFHNKTILIAGANGYVPQHFVHGFLMRNTLYQENIHVVALCRNERKAKERFGEYLDRKDFTLVIGDVLEEMKFEKKLDFIIDAASPAGVKASNENPVATFEANVMGCGNLLKLAQYHHAEFLYLSSVDIYGKKEEERFIEDRPGILDSLDVRNVYAEAKRAAENLCVCYGQKGVVCKIVRPGQIMGGGIAPGDGRLHIDFISQILKTDKIILKGDGTPVRTFIYITDAIAGMLSVMDRGNAGEAYNICAETGETSVLGLARLMAGQVKSRNISVEFNEETRKTDPAVRHAVSRVCASSEKLRGLGWNPQISLEESCRRMMDYYQVPL